MERMDLDITLDAGDQAALPTALRLTQGDGGAYRFLIRPSGRLLGRTGQARIVFTRPDSLQLGGTLEHSGGAYRYDVAGPELEVPGEVQAAVQWMDGDSRLSSARFSFFVQADLSRLPPAPAGEVSALQALVLRCEEALANLAGGIDEAALANYVRQGGDAVLREVSAERVTGAVWM